jgi:hypothetical protein
MLGGGGKAYNIVVGQVCDIARGDTIQIKFNVGDPLGQILTDQPGIACAGVVKNRGFQLNLPYNVSKIKHRSIIYFSVTSIIQPWCINGGLSEKMSETVL